ncbi:uncharacterized protein ACLA_023570 [Aspergillus clavatus NRRL 1]|uniref:Uncharacterized protein n=1 Tax=Aspergillus clavatus (strain ATCC 1007 / CBS 513.65 / DSM 816 / NCTC 3887 / NRRL 1 / QM 1276 / 107) TaxID=344612 RepID=A1CPS2_ASPCL|nr:uncharacterized protein ACLA_023570 [Aspergillus clavatus NRRL 1]EAW07643.1 conserved hypothetical protein [Aspergillus clavatus NRRL 1]
MGRFFRAGGSMQARSRLKKSIPASHERFQTALDDLSEQIFMAKAFLERDYEELRATRAALQPAEDVVMEEPDQRLGSEAAPESPRKEEIEPETEQADVKAAEEPVTTHQPSGAEQAQPEAAEKPVKVEKEDEPTPVPDQPMHGATDINFDSVLPDTGGGPNEFDLHLDFGDDDIGNQNFLSGSGLGSAGMGGEPSADQPGALDSAFPEAGDDGGNIPSGGDAFDLEFQKADTFPGQGQPADGQTGNNADDVIGPGESSFDDLFMENENFGGDGLGGQNLLGDELMNINELDDSWFS